MKGFGEGQEKKPNEGRRNTPLMEMTVSLSFPNKPWEGRGGYGSAGGMQTPREALISSSSPKGACKD